jgi:prepilin-type N-terminal cleavage/methylation domain-containing protein/prepilin-type processing-associated H-X9-DG protein
MTKASILRRYHLLAFTLVELLVVIAIISLLVTLALPSMTAAMQKARSMKCAANLRAIGLAASQCATDNNNQYPAINQAAAPVYPSGTPGVTNLIGALGPYGISTNSIQCPIDMQSQASAFSKYQSSYEWDPVFDNEPVNSTVIYITPTVAVPVNSSRVRLAMDFNAIHRGRPNVVYGDGHVSSH